MLTSADCVAFPIGLSWIYVLTLSTHKGRTKHAHSMQTSSAAVDGVARGEGFLLCPEGAATYAAYKQSLADGRVKRTDRVMLFNCATGLKYPLPPVTRTLDRNKPIDFAMFSA